MEKMHLRCLPLLALLTLAGCATQTADLDAKAPLQPGYGSFSVAIAMDTNAYPPRWARLVVAKPPATGAGDPDLFPLKLQDLPGTGLQVAYGTLPAGSYQLDDLNFSIQRDRYIAVYKAELPKDLSIDIQPGKHLDLGVLIYEVNPNASNKLGFGWLPSPAGVTAAEQAYLAGRTPVPPVLSPMPWKGAEALASEKVLSLFGLDNPAVNDLMPEAGGALLAPAHLGRILFRDASHAWHILDTGYLGDIVNAWMLKDGRIVALVYGGPVLVSDAAHAFWHALPLPAPGVNIRNLMLLDDGRLGIVTEETYMTTKYTRDPIPMQHYGVYVGDADKGGWKPLTYVDADQHYAMDSRGFYFYEAGKNDLVADIGVSDALTAVDCVRGTVRALPLPATTKAIYYLDGDVLLLKPEHDILNSSDYVSEDSGATWHAVVRDATNGSFHMNGELTWKAPGDYLADAGTRPPVKMELPSSPWKYGYYETKDYGKTWTYITEPVSQPCHLADVHDLYIEGKFWWFCEDGSAWTFDPTTRSVHQERSTLVSASADHG